MGSKFDVYVRYNTFKNIKNALYGYEQVISNWNQGDNSECYFQYNNIYPSSSAENLVELRGGYDDASIIATYNYWGSTDVDKISDYIFDENDDYSCAGEIKYLPILSEPYGDDILSSDDEQETPTQPNSTVSQETTSAPEMTIPSEKKKVYFKNTFGWNSVSAYIWDDETNTNNGWPGVPMNYVGSGDYWYIYANVGNCIIFTNGDDLQTYDAVIPAGSKNCAYDSGYEDMTGFGDYWPVVNWCEYGSYIDTTEAPTTSYYDPYYTEAPTTSYYDPYESEPVEKPTVPATDAPALNDYPESAHPYSAYTDKTWEIYREGATEIKVTFSRDTFVENMYDTIVISDSKGFLVGEYTGNALAGKTVTVDGDKVEIRLQTDSSGQYYGFKVTDVKAEYAEPTEATELTYSTVPEISTAPIIPVTTTAAADVSNTAFRKLANWIKANGISDSSTGRYIATIFSDSTQSMYSTYAMFDPAEDTISLMCANSDASIAYMVMLFDNNDKFAYSAAASSFGYSIGGSEIKANFTSESETITYEKLTNIGKMTDNAVVTTAATGLVLGLLQYDIGNDKLGIGVSVQDLGFINFYGNVPVTTTASVTEATVTTEEIPEELVVSDEPDVDKDSVEGIIIGYIGDTDANDKVNVRDATNVQKHMAKLISLSEKSLVLADADDNGKVNIKDATCIQKYIANISVKSKLKHLVYITGTHKHSYVDTVVAPKCEKGGYTLHSCICGDETRDSETSAIGHDYKSTKVAATCTERGYTKHTCSNCQDMYKDNYTDTVAHSYTSTVTKATCKEGGYTTYTCKNCNHQYKDNYTGKTDHSYTSKVTKPTCSKEGYTTYTCTVCSYSYTGSRTAATGVHNYNSSGKCKDCGYKKPSAPVTTSAFDKYVSWIKKNGSYDDGWYEFYLEIDSQSTVGVAYDVAEDYIAFIDISYYSSGRHITTTVIYRDSDAVGVAVNAPNYSISGYAFKSTTTKTSSATLSEYPSAVGKSTAQKLLSASLRVTLDGQKIILALYQPGFDLYDLGFKKY